MPTYKPIKVLPSRKYLYECFIYNRRTGELRWKHRPKRHFPTQRAWAVWNSDNAGVRGGNVMRQGHRRIAVNNNSYLEHRVIWKMMTGTNPTKTIDHADGDPANNAWSNLRLASQREQIWNAKRRSDNNSGYRGVSPFRNGWRARIWVYGNEHHLGCFSTAKAAFAAYEAAAQELHGKFHRRARVAELEGKVGAGVQPA